MEFSQSWWACYLAHSEKNEKKNGIASETEARGGGGERYRHISL